LPKYWEMGLSSNHLQICFLTQAEPPSDKFKVSCPLRACAELLTLAKKIVPLPLPCFQPACLN
jgi:hypothetical protein